MDNMKTMAEEADVSIDNQSLRTILHRLSDKFFVMKPQAKTIDQVSIDVLKQRFKHLYLETSTISRTPTSAGSKRYVLSPSQRVRVAELVDNVETEVGAVWEAAEVNGHRGNFARRLKKAIRELDIGITKGSLDAVISDLGGAVGSTVFKSDKYYLCDLASIIDWSDGDFSDEDSCYFGGDYDWCREAIEYFGGLAFRVHGQSEVANFLHTHQDDKYSELEIEDFVTDRWARCWLAPDKPQSSMALTFNTYGLGRYRMAKLIRTFLGLPFIRVHPSDTELYINGTSFAYGKPEKLQTVILDTGETKDLYSMKDVPLAWLGWNNEGFSNSWDDNYDDEDF